ncbi:amidohydrolase [Niameybacter massiliensis]|uniref:Amidohydrolase n=1 Tax=Holtiella tumoricola TaxID=3018743 RepID=A0AA42DPS3_9FIRM|nr:amidohydrolase [Holtiella tumoricola]MDA3733034.1 amidohydrolase [Holtiella tumoricola]
MKTNAKQVAMPIIEKVVDIAEEIFKNPELGYKEVRTVGEIIKFLEAYNIPYTKEVAYTGIIATIDSGKEGPHIGLVCDLDAVPTNGHPYCNPQDNGAHTCGHYAQIGVMLGVLGTIKEAGIVEALGGKVSFIGTPAEEFVDFDYRHELMAQGKIKYASGKQEMIHLGVFEDVDLVLSCHTLGTGMPYDAEIDATLNGFIKKRAVFHGKAAHAGANPSQGINALNAANLAMTGINFLRETFKEEDAIRVHFMLVEGGQSVNTIPERTTLDMYIRGKSVEAIMNANEKVDRALRAGGLAIGCDVEITDTPGYFPLRQDRNLTKVVEDNMRHYIQAERILRDGHGFASGDMGDISMIIPTVEIGTGGFVGTMHGKDFQTEDANMAYNIPIHYFIGTIVDLLSDKGQKVYEIKENFKPIFTRDEYLKTLENLNQTRMYKLEDTKC